MRREVKIKIRDWWYSVQDIERLPEIKRVEIEHVVRDEVDAIKELITEEINIAQKEGQPTSRLTSLYNKI